MGRKAIVELGGVELAANSGVVWKFTTGADPYLTTFSVHKTTWERTLSKLKGRPLTLRVVDTRGVETKVRRLFILEERPSGSPNRVAFVVADRRWEWAYEGVARDYNIPRRTGDRTADFESVPVESRVVIDRYDYLPYSLDGGVRLWTAKRAVEDVLEQLVGEAGFTIRDFPISDENRPGAGQFTLQNVSLRDQGNVALARLLSFVPGASVFVDPSGKVVVFDGADLRAAERHLNRLPPTTWDGERAVFVDRVQTRPSVFEIHYQREVEAVFDFSDDYSGTVANPGRSQPFLENVLPTVDPETEVEEFDPEENAVVTKTVPPGTWVRVDKWLAAMDKVKPDDSLPWTFATIRRHWLKGDLDGVLGARGLDLDEDGNVAMRVQALKQHFRQTFRINNRYMKRIRELRAVRVGLLDPVTGARAPAAVWGQACVVPTTKGKLMAGRKDREKAGVFRNVDYLAPSKAGTKLIQTPPGPTRVSIVDRDLGIFRLEWIVSPYGTVESFVPCHLVDENERKTVPTRDLSQQLTAPVGAGMKAEGKTNGIFLANKMEFRAMLTIVPAAPNNRRQFHREVVDAEDVAKLFRKELRVQKGLGPRLRVFVAPGEATARFAWSVDAAANSTIQELLGLDDDDPNSAGIPGRELPGFELVNERRHLTEHARALAAELALPFADSVMGAVATEVPRRGLDLQGNMDAVAIRVGAAPSAKVDAVHQFPGRQKPVPRFAIMPEAVRQIVLGIVPFKE